MNNKKHKANQVNVSMLLIRYVDYIIEVCTLGDRSLKKNLLVTGFNVKYIQLYVYSYYSNLNHSNI